MNGEKIKDPTADIAIGRMAWEEKQRIMELKHGIYRGNKVTMQFKQLTGDGRRAKIVNKRVKVLQLYKYHVVVRMPGGYKESFQWDEFWKAIVYEYRGGRTNGHHD